MKDPFIKIENLNFSYNGEEGSDTVVLKNLNLEIERGSLVAILGHNGSGKSTLAKLLNLILTPQSGKITIDGLEITSPNLTEDQLYENRRNVGMVFQNPDNQLVATIVEEDIAFGPENLGIEPKEIRRRVDEALKTVGMTEFARHSPHQLSGGQKQRVAIAGIIAMMPKCIIFDESTAMLDPQGRREVMDTIIRLNRELAITILHITHYMNEASLCDRVIVINEGKIELDGSPGEVFSHVSHLRKIGLDVPQTTELLYELGKSGIKTKDNNPLPSNLLSIEECADEIMKLFASVREDSNRKVTVNRK
jgi:energy-coupling factor transport system ATP-binding protein